MKMKKQGAQIGRREFIRSAAAASLAFQILPASARSANSRIQVGCIGIGGKGYSDTIATAAAGASIIALCDVVKPGHRELDRRKTAMSDPSIPEQFPDARFFADYREMIADMPGLDAVVVSTPDHHHFHASMAAMRKGKHVYCQKPISHSIWEARRMAEAAARFDVQTQMGNQAHAGEPIRRAVELIRAGVLGKVFEVHAWTNRPIWPQGMAAWPKAEPVPEALNWDLWIGPAPFREYSRAIAPFNWRGWWDFGAGALGDMGCHVMDMPYWALGLTAPVSVESRDEGGTEISGPRYSTISYHFPSSFFGVPVRFVWYDGVSSKDGVYQNTPPAELWKEEFPTADHVFRRFDLVLVGENGRMFFGRNRQDWTFRPESLALDFTEPPRSLPRVLDVDRSEDSDTSGSPYLEWLNAIKSGTPALSSFAVSGPFSETVLLGNLALRLGTRVDWDAATLSVRNAPGAASLVRRQYRTGWQME